MSDVDPSAPRRLKDATQESVHAANFGMDGAGDFPPGDVGLDFQESPDVGSVIVDIRVALKFLDACESSKPRVTYGLGKKITPGKEPGEGGFTQVDCSGFVREILRRSTDLGSSFPDGSVFQHEWIDKKNYFKTNVGDAKAIDEFVRIAFLPPGKTKSGIGHVVLIYKAATLESHGQVGPDSRPWNGAGWQGLADVYVLGPNA